MSSGLAFLENLLNALHSAKMPKVSFISEPWIGIENLDNLSPNVLHDFDGSLKKYAKMNISVGELVRKGLVKINNSERYSISLEFEGMETSLIEQFRADFNSDGVEDIFVRGWARAIGGTLGYGFSTILTRYSNKHLIEDISEEKKYSQKQHDLRTTELKNLIMNLRNKKNN